MFDDLDENDLGIMTGLTAIAAILEAGDRAGAVARGHGAARFDSPKDYTDRAAELFFAAGETLKSNPAFVALKNAGKRG